MVASVITIVPVYLDCTPGTGRSALSGGVSTLEDDTVVHESDSGTVSATEKSPRALQSWQLTCPDADSEDARFVWELFRTCRTSKGFLFVSPRDEDRVCIDQPLQNTTDDSYEGDGSTTTFQLQYTLALDYDIGSGTVEVDPFDVNYPLADSVVVYADGVEVAVSGFSRVTGIVTLTAAPANGAVMTADYERAIPVRFTSENLARTLFEGNRSEARSFQIKEIL